MLADIRSPGHLQSLGIDKLARLGAEIRDFLVQSVTRTGGHLGPNLGVVELTIALHRVFESPRDCILWDTGHQAYVHKLLTGRQDFTKLRRKDGLSGYPSRAESVHDHIENSHASTALSYADGMARAFHVQGIRDRRVVAVVGDGAMTGGMAWEALNNIAAAKERPVVVVINDNGRSYGPTVGGLAKLLSARGVSDRMDKDTLKGLFEDLSLRYVGPVDGHDIAATEDALRIARDHGGPVVVHCITRKGRGYAPAEMDDADCFHGIGAIDPQTGLSRAPSAASTWTSVFADEMASIGDDRPDVVAITAAMLRPVGLDRFAAAHPGRVFDVGIAEQHAATCAAGLAAAGMHPVIAVYATFLNRAFDQVLMDVALHRAGVTMVLDRAGITGDDGPSHNGVWDMSLLQIVPGLRIAAPRDAIQLREQLREAMQVSDAPTVIRFPKGQIGQDIPALQRLEGVDVLACTSSDVLGADVLLVSVGAMAETCLEVARILRGRGKTSTVVDPRWVKPVNPMLAGLAAHHGLVATVEDNIRVGGVGSALVQVLQDSGVATPARNFGIPAAFLPTASRGQLLAEVGLTATALAEGLTHLLVQPTPVR